MRRLFFKAIAKKNPSPRGLLSLSDRVSFLYIFPAPILAAAYAIDDGQKPLSQYSCKSANGVSSPLSGAKTAATTGDSEETLGLRAGGVMPSFSMISANDFASDKAFFLQVFVGIQGRHTTAAGAGLRLVGKRCLAHHRRQKHRGYLSPSPCRRYRLLWRYNRFASLKRLQTRPCSANGRWR